jgi:hypothetical protein
MANFSNAKATGVGSSVVTLKSVTVPTLVTGCNLVNKTATSSSISLYITNNSINYYIFKDKRVDGNSNVEAITGNKIVLINGDVLKAVSDTASSFDVVVSILDGF